MKTTSAHFITCAIAALSCAMPSHGQSVTMLEADSLPQQWTMERQYEQTLPTDDKWWQRFDDPVLTQLIQAGEENNYNLDMALKRIEVAKQAMNKARSAYFPSLGLSAGWTDQRSSGAAGSTVVKASESSYFSLGLSMNWEIDVFGRVAAQSKAAKAGVNYAKADYDAAMVSLCANIASTYFQLRMYQAELALAETHIKSQEKIMEMTQARYDAGLVSMLDVSQAKVVLYSTQSALPSIRSMINTSINSLAVLTGRFPASVRDMVATAADMPDFRQPIAAGVPSDLIRRRPDIAAAEAQLAEYAAAVGIAKKDYLPTLSLSGSIGTTAHRIGDLFTGDSFGWSIAPQLSWTVFDGLARRYNVASAKAQMEAGIDSYNQTVLTAVEEVENAMEAYNSSVATIDLLEKVNTQSKKSLDLSVDEYRQGLTAFTNVVNSQVDLLQYQTSYVEAHGKALVALVNLYQALGGGF